jgi:dipeptidyl aminopeptidase/acylaminoacyl peptidase
MSRTNRHITPLALLFLAFACRAWCANFTLEQVLSAPFASDITASTDSSRFAWVSNRAGARNVWLAVERADHHGFQSAALTRFTADDGQDIYDLTFVPQHNQLLFVRGGDRESPDKPAPNPAELTAGTALEIYLAGFDAAAPVKLAEGHAPAVSPDGTRIVFLRHGEVFSMPVRQDAKPEPLFKLRGAVTTVRFSPDGRSLALVSNRGDHSFIGLYRFADQSLLWLDPALALDDEPRWSADGTRIAFLRVPATPDEVGIKPHRTGPPWSIRCVEVATGRAWEIYRAPEGAGSVFYPLSSDAQLFWSDTRLIFPSEKDGWLHLYSVPIAGGAATLLTPGEFEIEFASASPDGHRIVYASNAGDIDRRHLWELDTATGHSKSLTSGKGIETEPAVLSDGRKVAFLRADFRAPAHAAVIDPDRPITDIPAETVPPDFPARALVEPASVRLPERAGVAAHGILFVPPADANAGRTGGRRPALIFMHGGPVRQMLLGWHYMAYYSNAYAMNQYLANHGYVVVALNYRSGIGYGLDFRAAEQSGAAGASEYNDVLAASDLLRARTDVDPARIGLWGGSYGGYLTALGLARNSDLFAAGVDFHGVHDWHHWTLGLRDNQPLYVLDTPASVLDMALAASPLGSVARWRSPVLLIAGDDDHNVAFSETVRLAEALRARGVSYSELIFPDEIHDFLRHESWVRAYTATADFFQQHLR